MLWSQFAGKIFKWFHAPKIYTTGLWHATGVPYKLISAAGKDF